MAKIRDREAHHQKQNLRVETRNHNARKGRRETRAWASGLGEHSRRASVCCWKQVPQTDASEHVRFRCLFWLCFFFGYFLGEKVLKYKVCFDQRSCLLMYPFTVLMDWLRWAVHFGCFYRVSKTYFSNNSFISSIQFFHQEN